jgi:hypothetical protein
MIELAGRLAEAARGALAHRRGSGAALSSHK